MKKLIVSMIILIILLASMVGGLVWYLLARPQAEPKKQPASESSQTTVEVDNSQTGQLKTSLVKLYMFAPEGSEDQWTGETVGCGSKLVSVDYKLTGPDELADTYLYLLSQHNQTYGQSGLRNALWQSSLSLRSAKVDEQGVAHIGLSGSVVPAGVCDNPRIEAQLERPALQFKGVKSVQVTVNGQTLESVLSLR